MLTNIIVEYNTDNKNENKTQDNPIKLSYQAKFTYYKLRTKVEKLKYFII